MNDLPEYKIRPAVIKDIPLIISFIRKLAAYENIGAEKKDEWDYYSLSGEPFKKLTKYK